MSKLQIRLVLFFSTTFLFCAIAKDDLAVLLIRPNTTNVADVSQITVTFNKTMVPLGDYEKLAEKFKINITPLINCQWRWLNGSTIACQLADSLPPSNSYTITVPVGPKALDGSTLKAPVTGNFSTLEWKVLDSEIDWKGPDSPLIYMHFNQPMDVASLQANTTSPCGRMKVSSVKASAVEDFGFDFKNSYQFSFDNPIGIDKNCIITVAASAKATHGTVPSSIYTYSFRTFPQFKITKVSCQENIEVTPVIAGAVNLDISGCDPDSGLNIDFSAPTNGKNLVGKIKVTPHFGWTEGGEGSPEYYKQYPDQEYFEIYLRSPMQGAGKHKVVFSGIKDIFGRALVGISEINVSTSDFLPILQLPEGYGVLEKEGPHQLAFSGVNARDFDFDYFTSQNVEDVKMWSTYDHGCDEYDKSEKKFIFADKIKKAVIVSGGKKNIPFSSPIDFNKITPDFKYGMIVGKMTKASNLDGKPFVQHRICSSTFTVITDLGIMAKVGFYNSGIWIHSIKSGLPLSGIKVSVYSNTATLFGGTTDENGFVEFPGAKEWDPERSKFSDWDSNDSLYIVAQTKDDFSMLPFSVGRAGIDYYNFNVDFNPLKVSTNQIVYAITDRPLYKPGQQVNVKVFARHWEPKSYGLTPVKKLTVEVKDALYKTIATKKIKLSDFGTANFVFDLDASVPLGTYIIQVASDGEYRDSIGTFDVQVFTLPVFKLNVESSKESYVVGDSANFLAKARYHFGGGVPNTTGNYTANFTSGVWTPQLPKWESFEFGRAFYLNIPGYEKPRYTDQSQIGSGSLTTDKNGDVETNIMLPIDQLKSYGKLEFGVSFADDRGKSIGGYNAVEVFYSNFMIGMKTPQWAYAAKEEIIPEVILLDSKEEPVAGVKVELTLINRIYKTVRRSGEGSYFYYDNKTIDKEIASCRFVSDKAPKGCGLQSKAAGDHYIVATAKDSRGRITQTSLQKYVTGKEYIGWYRENSDRIEIIPDKRIYQMGETVQLMVKNPYQEVDALITLERFGILKQFRQKLVQGAEIIKIPVDSKEYTPGFFVSVQLIKGRVSDKIEGGVDLGKPSFKMGMVQIEVVDPDTVLAISAKSDREQYEPGEKTEVSLEVSSPGGNDVAELSVAVVDEKILQLAGDYEGRYKLHDKFYKMRGGDVITSQMLSFIIGRRHFGQKGAPAGGDGDSGNKSRKKILPLAYWNPSVITDSDGKAHVNFTLPDNLTTWRVLVVAADKQHRFGFGSGTFRATKKVMVEPSLPSFLTEGDKFKSRFTVFNRTGAEAKFKGELKVTGVILNEDASKEANIANDGKSYMDWKISVPVGQINASFEMMASSDKGKDGILEKLPIMPYASYETFATYGSTIGSKVSEKLQIPKGIRPELGGLEVMVSSSLISHLDDSFRYLFNYPYSCWEQTLVRAIALSQYIRLKEYISIPELSKDAKKWAQELLAEMPKFQYMNGAMAYWKADPRTIDPYLSVFTLQGLRWIEKAEINIPKEANEKLLSYVRKLVQGKEIFPEYYSVNAKATVMAMATAVLSDEGDNMVSSVNKRFQERANLDLFGKSFLWHASTKFKETNIKLKEELKKDIYAMADLSAGKIQFKETPGIGMVTILHSATRSNCALLSSMLAEDPEGKFIESLVRFAIDARKANRWNNTQDNLYCLNALANYAAVFEKDLPNYSVSGKAMNKEIKEVKFKGFKESPKSETFVFTPEIVGKKSEVNLEKDGSGRMYYTARLKIAYKEVRTTSVNAGLQVERTYFVKSADGKWQKVNGVVKLKRGQVVRVDLKVKSPSERHQVALEDRLPAGLEPINTALGGSVKEDAPDANENQGEGEGEGEEGYYAEDDWYSTFFNGGFYHKEMRLHAVQYFANYLGKADFNLSYSAQAIAVGEFNASPAIVEEMYNPEVYGKSTPAQFIIEE